MNSRSQLTKPVVATELGRTGSTRLDHIRGLREKVITALNGELPKEERTAKESALKAYDKIIKKMETEPLVDTIITTSKSADGAPTEKDTGNPSIDSYGCYDSFNKKRLEDLLLMSEIDAAALKQTRM